MGNIFPGSLRKILFIFPVLMLFCQQKSNSQVSIITERIRNDQVTQNADDNEISGYLDNLKPDGSWADIDYGDPSITNWPAVNHSRRLLLICRAYNKPSSRHYHNSDVKNKIIRIIDFYIAENPKSKNWWYNAIGAPTNFGPALVLMKTDDEYGLAQPVLESYADKLLYYYSESSLKWPSATTGANKIWLISSSIDKACIKNNDDVLRSDFHDAFEEASVMTGKIEGIKIDFSFWQHGPQLYCGGYGMSFLSDITQFGNLAFNTDYQMSTDQLNVLTDAVLDGFQWFCQKSAFDFGAAGREISRRGALSSLGLRNYANRLISMHPAREAELKNLVEFINGTAPFQSPGNKHFWKSDIMVQHGTDFYLSAKVPSKRTIGTERMNNENLKRKWLPWGATNIMKDGDEYRNIFASWDWSKIPGVTSVSEPVQGLPVTGGSYLISNAEFAGGVSNGEYGFAAYDYSWDGVSARKAYFFTPSAMYCLGAGIKASKTNPVITTINQCFSSGDVTISMNASNSVFNGSTVNSKDINWIYHDRIGYFFPSGGNVYVKNDEQTGSWNDINTSQSDAPVTNKVFSAWIDHGNSPSGSKYEYLVIPSASLKVFEYQLKNNSCRLISNTTDLQAVEDRSAGIFGFAFYNPGTIIPEAGLSVTVDKPCLLLIKRDENRSNYSVTVADPTTSLSKVTITLAGQLSGTGAVLNTDNTTTITVDLPQGDEAGKSVTNNYSSLMASDQSSFDEILAFPNPSSGAFTLSNLSDIERINVVDQCGRVCINTRNIIPDTFGETWPGGLYLLMVEYKNKIVKNQKLIKTRL